MDTTQPATMSPPNTFIIEEMVERGWSVGWLARAMGTSTAKAGDLICGRAAITPQVAEQLATAFDTSAGFWLKLDDDFRGWLDRLGKD